MASEEIKAELAKLAEKAGGRLMPEAVVEFARNPSTALHSQFDWDDSEAASKWRLEQARGIIRVQVEVKESGKQSVPVYVHLRSDREEDGGYRRLVDVLSDNDLREQLLTQAKQDMRTFKKKYEILEELAHVREAMEEVLL